jgi:hypothetical protein
MVRKGNGTKWLWYENDFHYGTKWLYTQVHAACWYRKKYVFKTGKKTNKKKYTCIYIMLLCIIIYSEP